MTMAETEVQTTVAGGQEPPPTERELFKFATWVHLGPGAEDCDGLERDEETKEVVSATGCGDPAHFHAWCRLPNSVQHEDLRVKALAARARHIRLLRDPETDEAVVLDAELDDLRAGGDAMKEPIVEELLGKTFWKSYLEATRDVVGMEGEDGESKPYEHIEEDQRRYNDLRQLSDEDRAGQQAEYDELLKHLAAFNTAVNERHEELREPEREALMARSLDDLLAMLRDDRVSKAAEKVFGSVYSRWEWLACTLMQPGGAQKFTEMAALAQAAPEVLEALEDTFNDLEQTRNARAAGNA
jgi:hypothetical protein